MSTTATAPPPVDIGSEPVIERRVSLSRGPALTLGVILLGAGLYLLYKQHRFPPLSNVPNGRAHVDGEVFLGIFGANGWTGMGTAIAGGPLLFGSAQHHLAKAMSLIVGVVAVAAALIAAVSGDVVGLAAANRWTELGWGACGVILLLNAVVPPRHRRVTLPRPGVQRTPTRAARIDQDAPARERDDSLPTAPASATAPRTSSTTATRTASTGEPPVDHA
jgi:hypothetical protein